jgi:hypothetical protein
MHTSSVGNRLCLVETLELVGGEYGILVATAGCAIPLPGTADQSITTHDYRPTMQAGFEANKEPSRM